MHTDTAPFKRHNLARGLISFLFVGTFTTVAYGVYLHTQGNSAQFIVDNLSWWVFIPDSFLKYIAGSGWTSTVAAVAITSVHWFLFTVIAGLVAYIGRYSYNFYINLKRTPSPTKKEGTSRHKLPPNAIPEIPGQIEPTIIVGDDVVRDLYPRYNLILKKLKYKNDAPADAIAALQDELSEVLLAHKGHTADPKGNHADVDLLTHSYNVAKSMQKEMPDNRLAPIIGLAHDIGKILAYREKKTPNGKTYWERRSSNHDFLSAQIVRSLPSFHAIPEEAQRTINLVVTYAHNPQRLPHGQATPEVRHLLNLLRTIDGLETAKDKNKPADNIHNEVIMKDVVSQLPKALAGLNINQAKMKDANADGWTSQFLDIVVVQEKALRMALTTLLEPRVQNSLSLGAAEEKKSIHPSAKAISTALDTMGLIMFGYNKRACKQGLHTAISGRLKFKNVWVLKREELGNLVGSQLTHWGNTEYPLKVTDYSA